MEKDKGYNSQYYITLDHNLIFDCRFHIYEEDIDKSSSNIIDLIEVGDYVNGEIVNEIWINLVLVGQECRPINEKYITSIVTKEQFERCEYKL